MMQYSPGENISYTGEHAREDFRNVLSLWRNFWMGLTRFERREEIKELYS